MFQRYTPKFLTKLVKGFTAIITENLWSNLKFLAQVPKSSNVQTSIGAFSIVGPKLWNGLPVILKVKENIKDFKVALKLIYLRKVTNRLNSKYSN